MNNHWKILQYVLAAVLALSIILGIRFEAKSNTAFEDMAKAVTSQAELEVMSEADNQMLRRLYGLDANALEGVLLYYPQTNMGAEELLLVKVSSPEEREAVKAAVESRLAAQMKAFDGYGVGQYELLEKAVIENNESYFLFCVGAKAPLVQEAYRAAYRGRLPEEVQP